MNQEKTVRNILSQREDFLIIGLTGRMGSGCSKVAEVLATPYEEMNFPHPIPQKGQESLSEEGRILRILADYAESHWLKFDVIRVGAVIATFILNDDSRFLFDLSNGGAEEDPRKYRERFQRAVFKDFYIHTVEIGKKYNLLLKEKEGPYIKETVDKSDSDMFYHVGPSLFYQKLLTDTYLDNLKNELEKLGTQLKNLVPTDSKCSIFDASNPNFLNKVPQSQEDWDQVKADMSVVFRKGLEQNPAVNRRKYLEYTDDMLTLLSFHCMMQMLDELLQKGEGAAEAFWTRLSEINKSVDPNAPEKAEILQIHKFVFVKYITTWLGCTVRAFVTNCLGDDAYARLFQRYGQMIRYYSCIPSCKEVPSKDVQGTGTEKLDIFAIPRKINQHIKVLRHPFDIKEHRPVRIVIDSIKNIFEAVYLRYRYSAFYLWAITTDGNIRERRLHDKHLTDIQIRKLEWNEYPDQGSEVIKKVDKLLANKGIEKKESTWGVIRDTIVENLKNGEAEADFYLDCIVSNIPERRNSQVTPERENYYSEINEFNCIRLNFFRDGTYVFYTQDVDGCVCNADVYLFNNAKDATDTENNVKLLQAVVRNVSLVMYPGLVRPTPVERCMQIAFSAKVNSGCLSRQVGAVVTDSQFNILAIGWNDVPCGEVPCAYKNLNDLSAHADQDAYSEYELHNSDFRERLSHVQINREKLQGLPLSYCFKDIHKDGKDPMRSRAMHAEEKALALCGREAEGGYLFTTSSPCEMCSKNAKNHKIKKIYYLEAYPGISQAQYTNSGDKDNRAELILFSGAVGRAYMQMYTPLLPHKDVLKYLEEKEQET